jgi:hypothetical protein
MHTGTRKVAFIILILLVAVALAAAVWLMFAFPHRAVAPTPAVAMATYSSSTYGYSFSYPSNYAPQEYSPEYVVVGTPNSGGGTDAVADIDLVTADASDGYASYEDFVHTTAMNDCAADGPGGSIACTAIASDAPYVTASGAAGEELFLTQVAVENGVTATSTRGPLYAFDVSAENPSDAFAALLVHVPISGDDASNTPIVAAIVNSLTLPAAGSTGSPQATSTPSGMQTITNADNNETVTLTKGEQFDVAFGQGLNWSLAFDPVGIVTQVATSTTAGIQGTFEAASASTTTLHATGAPICAAGEACPQFREEVTVTLVVN